MIARRRARSASAFPVIPGRPSLRPARLRSPGLLLQSLIRRGVFQDLEIDRDALRLAFDHRERALLAQNAAAERRGVPGSSPTT